MPRGGARVGVLPLQLIGTSEAESHLSSGIADEITSALARFRWMFLVSSSSLARFAHKPATKRRSGALSPSTSCSTAASSVCRTGSG